LGYEWFNIVPEPPPLSVGVQQALQHYSQATELKRAVYLLVAAQADLPQLTDLAKLHSHLDVDNTGQIPLDRFRPVLLRSNMSPMEVERVLEALDRNGDSKVGWMELVAAAISVLVSKPPVDDKTHGRKTSSTDFSHLIRAACGALDVNNDGWLVVGEIASVLGIARRDSALLDTELEALGAVGGRLEVSKLMDEMYGFCRVAGGDKLAAV